MSEDVTADGWVAWVSIEIMVHHKGDRSIARPPNNVYISSCHHKPPVMSVKLYRIAIPCCIGFVLNFSYSVAQAPLEIQSRGKLQPLFVPKSDRITVSPVPVTSEFKELLKTSSRPNTSRISSKDNYNMSSLSICKDSSYKKLLNSGTLTYGLYCSGKTSDGGIILGGYGRNMPDPPPYIFYGMLVKIDSAGNFIWGKELRANGTSAVLIKMVRELSDGSLIVCGDFDNGGDQNTMVAKLTSDGSLVWVRTFKSNTLVCTLDGNPFFINELVEGANGDLLISGFVTNCSVVRYALIYKLDNAGALQWSTAFQYPSSDGTGFGMLYQNNAVKLLCHAGGPNSGTDNVVHTDIIKLDYLTGSFLSMKSWQVNMAYPDSYWFSFSPQVYAKKLDNGDYCVYGELNGDWTPISGLSHHFGVIEFNSNDDFIKGYTINSSLAANANGTSAINIDGSGRCVFSFFSNYTGTSLDLFMGSVNDGNILKLRYRRYETMSTYGLDAWELFSDHSYIFLKQLSNIDNTNERIEFSRLHDSDTSSDCLGVDSNFCFLAPANYIPYNSVYFSNTFSNAVSPTSNGGIVINSQFHIPQDVCPQTSICDTLKIHGKSNSCDLNQDFIFTAFKNPSCGSWVTWTIDTTATFAQQVNDTTLKIHFKETWQGYLYASIRASCGVIKDSLWISVSESPGSVYLGRDTSLCPSNTIVLNAHKGYASYLWQDDSADSTLTVAQPGTYYVKATDACGNISRDTLQISAAPPITFDIGPARQKCNDDTIHLDAPDGFLNYTWSPMYNINPTSSQHVVVNPSVDTSYSVKAEKTPGCFAYDTVRVTVHSSTPIHLGNDKNFCAGDSAVINAGAGFSEYQWNTGATTQQITVHSAGSYSVIGTTAEGCKSSDTLQANAFTLPLIDLDPTSTLCSGSSRTLSAGNGFVSYLWNTGSTAPFVTVHGTGTYSVVVVDGNGCTGSDTVVITTLLPSPADFLPADTDICSYGKLTLNATGPFRHYQWSNNETSASITISQPGLYWLTVTDNHNCTGKDSILVHTKDCMEGFFAPSAFTPNNDGKNDIFRPLIFGNIKQYQFTIYNRWGQIVFQTREIGKGWDGNFAGMQQDPNVFTWTCTYQLEGEGKKSEKGIVTLIR